MPFIRGRYHINPIAGAALEGAREAEEALAALHNAEEDHEAQTADGQGRPDQGAGSKGPIHRVEIETAEVVPAHSGRGQRGFVARIHRVGSVPNGDQEFFGAPTPPSDSSNALASSSDRSGAAPTPETHVFSNHQDLTDFLNGEFDKDHRR
jgi:hypothetical protein